MIVVKAGGGTTLNVDAVVADIVALRATGTELLLVHGGAQTTNQVAEALGHPPQFVTSETGHVSRRTDRRTLEIFEMVGRGMDSHSIASKLELSSKTVDAHKANIRQKLGLDSARELLMEAVRWVEK